ncbi:MFS transporter [Nevskia ramosa]|uniref:MFS transporter n=1 Tax=Nevskia ramosa TaxID=64002 RepID=UPI0003B3314D|nr:MFS transporter [Nevskia ramosa]
MATAEPAAEESAVESAVYGKIDRRIVPVIMIAYVLAFLDRINVGYAQLQMKQSLGFSDAVYGLGAGIFFLSYFLCELPSNLWMQKIGARLTFLRIMVLWGLTSAATMFVVEPWQFYGVRLLLGVFEAGFFPGVILYLTWWYPSHRRGRVTGLFLFGIPITGMIGGPLSGAILTHMDGVNGLAGWQWLFVLEGLPTALFGVLVYVLLADRPGQATWLDAGERQLVQRVLDADQATGDSHDRAGALTALADPRTYVMAGIYFCCACSVYTFTFWLPTLIKALNVGSLASVGLWSALPYAAGGIGILLISASSDRMRERRWHVALTLALGTSSLYATTLVAGAFWPTMVLLCLSAVFSFSSVLFWAIPPTYLGRESAAAGIAVISSIGILGGFVSPSLMGWMKGLTGSLDAGLLLMAGIAALGALATVLLVPATALRVGRAEV